MILRRRQARRATAKQAQAVVEFSKQRLAFAERSEILFAERTRFAQTQERGIRRAVALFVGQAFAELQGAGGEVNFEHPARPVFYVRAARSPRRGLLAFEPFAHAARLGAQALVARSTRGIAYRGARAALD